MECCLAVQLIPTKELRVGLFSKAVALLTSGKNVQLFGPGNFSKVFNIKRISSLFSFFLTQSMNRCFQAYLTREMVITYMIRIKIIYNIPMISIILKSLTITIMVVTRLTMSTPMWFSVGAAVTTITREAKIEMVIFLFILC